MSLPDSSAGPLPTIERLREPSSAAAGREAGALSTGAFQAEVFVVEWEVAAESATSIPPVERWGRVRNEGVCVSLDG